MLAASGPILALARSGAISRAWDAFVSAGLEGVEEVENLTLKGRLLKDKARQAEGRERAALFAQAGAAYERAAALRPESYPLINASAMALFAGDRVRSELLASKVLHLIETGKDKGETPYWREATRAEALLLLGRQADAERSCQKAVELAPLAWEDRAATLRQLALIASQTAVDVAWLDRFRPPPVLHYSGILGIASDDRSATESIQTALGAIAPGFAFGALAAGADIIAAETLMASGSELNVVLPSDPSDFYESSVAPFGADWKERFAVLLQAASSVTICNASERTSTGGVALAEYHAMGLVAELAGQLEATPVAVRIEPDGRPTSDNFWLRSGRQFQRVVIDSELALLSAPLPSIGLTFDLAVDGGPIGCFSDLGEAVDALAMTRNKIAAFDCRIDGHQRVRALLAHGLPDMLVTSRSAALALLAFGAVQHIEPVGEMATSAGSIDICLTRILWNGR